MAPRLATASPPLAQRVMHRAGWVAVATLALATALGLQRASENIDQEVQAAAGLATVMAQLNQLGGLDDRESLNRLGQLQASDPLRHLELRIHDAQGRLLLAPPPAAASAAWLELLLGLHRRVWPDGERRLSRWPLPRPLGPAWTVSLTASHDSERREALTDLLGMLAVIGAGALALLLVMRANVNLALRPLDNLLDAIRGIESSARPASLAVQDLPAMPVHELAVIAAALHHLAQALDQTSAERRALSLQLVSLQEDERNHLARELHDEFGQRLTALRLDAAWLRQRLMQAPVRSLDPAELLPVVEAMAERCAEVQADIRQLLVRLRPLGPELGDASAISWAELADQLQALLASWQPARPLATGAIPGGLAAALAEVLSPAGGQPADPASGSTGGLATDLVLDLPAAAAAVPDLPRPLALAIYRLSQEALTNVARHAAASRCTLSLRWEPASTAPGGRGAAPRAGDPAEPLIAGWLHWEAEDDGRGISDGPARARRGNGLGGMQERVWALGGEWHWGAAGSARRPDRPGLRLRARIPVPAMGTPKSSENGATRA